MPKLTQATITRIRPTREDFIVWDSELRGFGLRVKPSGVRSFIVQYRTKSGRSRRKSIARYGVMTAEEARKEAVQLLAAVARGEDPAAAEAEAKQAPTVEELGERYLREHALPHKKPSSVASDRRLLRANIVPKLGKTKVAAVSRADVARLHHGMRQTPYEANRTLALLSKMFSLAELWGLRPNESNPCRHVKRYREEKRERFFSGEELGQLGQALKEAERSGRELSGVVAAIWLLALTGCRLGEIRSLRWEDVDLEQGILHLRDTKAGRRAVPLGAPAQTLIAGLKRSSGFVVQGPDPEKPLPTWIVEKAWARIRRRAGLPDARLHDFRHTVGTFGGQAGFNAFLVRDLLGHKTLAMTGRYVERDHDPVRAAANQVSERVAAAMARSTSGEVVTLRPARGSNR